MAQNRNRGGAAPRTATRSESKKPAAKTAPRATAPAPVEIVEEEKGLGIDDGIIILTTLMLLVAVLMIDYNRGKQYGEGILFTGSYAAPTVAAN